MQKQIKAIPTKAGNGFTAGKVYEFTHHKNSLYVTLNDNGHERFECFDEVSGHLWDGVHWDEVGKFEIIK